jgi:hypothetical protein
MFADRQEFVLKQTRKKGPSKTKSTILDINGGVNGVNLR